MATTPLTAVVFDMDGTLIETEEIWDGIRRGLAAKAGLPWPEEATRAMMGMSTQEWSAYLSEVVGIPGTAEDAARATIDALLASYEIELPILRGAVESVKRMHSRWPVAVASSSPRQLIDAGTEKLGIKDLLATTLSTEEVAGGIGKPEPDVFLQVCATLGASPTHSVAIEDSTNGLLSAHAAGMIVIAVPPSFKPPKAETLALADVVLGSLDELTIELVEELVAKR